MRAETLAIHASNINTASTGDVITPISLSTTFLRGEDGGYPGGFSYSRANSPNRAALESVLTALEYGQDACAFSSGNTAGMSVFQALPPGSHIIAPDDMYWGLKKQLETIFASSLQVDFIDQTDLGNIEAHIKDNTRLIWIETPSNPLLKLTDIAAIAAIAKHHGALLVCDNTFASPVLQNPLNLGADMVLHSITKYIGGHSDVLGGALITADKDSEFWNAIRNIQQTGGAVATPFDCFLTIRSIKTLSYRIKGHCYNAGQLTHYLSHHPKVEAVLYPGLSSHPQHALARKQMKDFGGMFAFLLKDGEATARSVVNKTKLFIQATSLGGVESLIEHRASVEGPDTKTPAHLVRISVGLEHIDDLIEDLEQALQ
ncbi:MAG: aminotransferase class I/II-fold pyridoxal phosphate-dependent enzyme [Chitinophagaceae bacterium]|nr:aminotransferase class I/II-fold pyridoxal phosphate-dependent enzyme [Chitinophagaceae bacterium]